MKLNTYFFIIFLAAQWAFADPTDSVGEMLNAIKNANGKSGFECGGKTSQDNSLVLVTAEKCASRDKFFRSLSGKTMSVEAAVQWLSNQKSQVIILGENHYSPSYEFQPELVRELISKNKNINCLFFEENSRFNSSSEKVDKDFSKLDYYYTWKKSAEVATKMGVTVYYIDDRKLQRDKNGEILFYAGEPKGMEYRNERMSARVSDLISSGACKAGIAINGKEHLFENFSENGYHSLQSMIKGKGVSVRTVNLQDYFRPDWEKPLIPKDQGLFPRSSEHDFSWNWKDCPANPHVGNERAAFRSTKADQVPFAYFGSNNKRSGSWSDFDLNILLP